MKELLILYLLMSATHILPLSVLTLVLACDKHLPPLPNTTDDQVPMSRRARLDRLRRSAMKNYLKEWAPMTLLVQITIVTFLSLAISYDFRLPFIPNIELEPGVMFDLFIFAVVTAFIQVIPIFFLILAGAKIWRITPLNAINRTLNSAELALYDEPSDGRATIRLSRFKTFEKTIIYAYCKDNRTGEFFNFTFVKRHVPGARTQCYIYHNHTVERIIPAPISVSELESIFNFPDN